MHDFTLFVRHLRKLLHLVRGVFLGFAVVLVALALIFAWAEEVSIWDAVYFILITGFTVGYGDIVPVTAVGRMVSVAAALIGVVLTGLYVAVATRALAEAGQERSAAEKRDGF